jgi:nitrile hydratase
VDGIHDLGGMHGFGPVEVEPGEPTFHETWQGRVAGMMGLLMARGAFNIDAFRHAIERLDPVSYLTIGYYGRWLASVVDRLQAAGFLAPGELEARVASLAAGKPPLPAQRVEREPEPPGRDLLGYRRDVGKARFALGDAVRARASSTAGHTRLPGYARGRLGHVTRLHGGFVFPDTNAHDAGEQPQHLYTVCYTAHELWGDEAEAPGSVYLDLFEPYLESA